MLERRPTGKRVVITADDFGLSSGINEAVIRAYRDGVLTSASIVANGPAFAEAVELARVHPKLMVGLHLNVYRGRPVTEPTRVSSLVAAHTGMFLESIPRIMWRVATGRLSTEELAVEFRAQADRLIAAGVAPTHLDSERHLHHAPGVRHVVIRLAQELGIKRIRVVAEPLSARLCWSLVSRGQWDKLAAQPVFTSARREFLAAGFLVPERSFGFFRPMTRETLVDALQALPEGLSEIICHPGLEGSEVRSESQPRRDQFFTDQTRAQELAALLDPHMKRLLACEGIRVEPS